MTLRYLKKAEEETIIILSESLVNVKNQKKSSKPKRNLSLCLSHRSYDGD